MRNSSRSYKQVIQVVRQQEQVATPDKEREREEEMERDREGGRAPHDGVGQGASFTKKQ